MTGGVPPSPAPGSWAAWGRERNEARSFSAYYDVSPRFCSEFGYQSFPSLGTIRSYAKPEDWNVTSPVMEHHQRNPRGNSMITEMFTRYFRVPEGFESFVYLSQVQQALAIRTAVEHWRRLRPLCMGTLYWQLNDTWPVCSWSSLEYDGTWKLLHYAARRFFAPVLLAAQVLKGRLEVWLTNDGTGEARCRATVRVIDFSGKVRRKVELPARAAAGSARMLKAWDLAGIAPRLDEVFVSLALVRDGETTWNETFLTEPKRCALLPARITTEVTADGGRFLVGLSSDAPAFYAALTAEGIPGEFSDNCVTILPDAPRTIAFVPRTKVGVAAFRRALSVRHLRETYR